MELQHREMIRFASKLGRDLFCCIFSAGNLYFMQVRSHEARGGGHDVKHKHESCLAEEESFRVRIDPRR